MSDNLFEPQEGQQQNSTSTADQDQGQQAPQAQESNVGQPADPNTLFADQLSGIKDESGRQKYADVNTALNSIPHAQSHISNLEKQVKELQEELNKREGMEQVLERIQATQEPSTEQPSANGLDAAQLETLLEQQLEQRLNQREQAKVAMENEITFSNTLREKYGEKALDVLNSKAQELGISTSFMQSLAQKSPKAALKYFDDVKATEPQPTTPAANTSALTTPAAPDKLSAAKAKLFGQSNPNIDKWREAGSTFN